MFGGFSLISLNYPVQKITYIKLYCDFGLAFKINLEHNFWAKYYGKVITSNLRPGK